MTDQSEAPVEVQPVYRLGPIVFVPRYRERGLFASPGTYRDKGEIYSAHQLKAMGAVLSAHPLWSRGE